jgi:MFS superfamily sulfate permease-like transporter
MFGISSKLNTRAATYKVIIDTFKNLKFTTLDAAFGIPCLVGLYAMKWTCNWVEKRFPRYRRTAFFVSVTRNALMVIIFTVVRAFSFPPSLPSAPSRSDNRSFLPSGRLEGHRSRGPEALLDLHP